MKIFPVRSVNGMIQLPGDKSISHRAAMLASIANGTTRIRNFAASEDCTSTLDCFRSLGVSIKRDGATVVVNGAGGSGLGQPTRPLDCGNSGTTMRLISGILAGQKFRSVLTGDESLQKRPMKRVIDPLSQMGASFESVSGCSPLTIHGHAPLRAIEYLLPVASAQIKSCILLAGLFADGRSTVLEPVRTRDHTERMLRWFGAEVEVEEKSNGSAISVAGGSRLTGCDLSVPADISSAAFFMVAASCLPGSELVLPNVGVNPSRRAIIDVLIGLGVSLEILDEREVCNEPVATISIRGGFHSAKPAHENVLRGEIIANLIDEIPILAVLATQLDSGIEIRDAGELRVKESDRIHSIVTNLKQMNANVTEFSDGFRVEKSQLKGAPINSFGDHRIAMAFAIAGLFADGESEIDNAGCADISFPGFFETLNSVVR